MTIAARLLLLIGFLVAPMFSSADTAQAQIVAIGAVPMGRPEKNIAI